MRREYRGCGIGPGGLGCGCCNPYMKDKPKLRRLVRRKGKASTRKGEEDGEEEVYPKGYQVP